MKKIFTFIVTILGTLALIYSCTKENAGNSKPIQKSADADSLKKAVLGSSCKRTIIWASYPYPETYTVIGNFPANANYTLPKQIWKCGNYELNNQSDGNLVIYDRTNGGLSVKWDLTRGYNKNPKFVLQTDMNFVEYDSNNNPLWDSGSYVFKCDGKNPRNARLILTSRGELKIIADAGAYSTLYTGSLGSTLTYDNNVHTGGQGYWQRFDTDENNPNGMHLVY